MTIICNVCKHNDMERLYTSNHSSLSSLSEELPFGVDVFLCPNCTHVMSLAELDVDDYYDKDYNILTTSDDEDQIYKKLGDQITYRTEHQINTLESLVNLRKGARILDYGCAKSSNMKLLLQRRNDIDVFLFDVSDQYIDFWKQFLTPQHWSIYQIPEDWLGSMDLVTSFFSLEHVVDPMLFCKTVSELLNDKGVFYGVIPYFITNSGDLIVSDHVNHFTPLSLHTCLKESGFGDITIHLDEHKGALVFQCKKEGNTRPPEITGLKTQIRELGTYWSELNQKISAKVSLLSNHDKVSIYGAGFYGAFIRTCFEDKSLIKTIYDNNPYLIGKSINGIPVRSSAEFDNNTGS